MLGDFFFVGWKVRKNESDLTNTPLVVSPNISKFILDLITQAILTVKIYNKSITIIWSFLAQGFQPR
jgi:hypothetical protein